MTAALDLRLPLVGPLAFAGNVDLRYFVDEDKRPEDLELVLSARGRLMVPFAESFSLFLFVDAFIITGKAEGQQDPGGSWITGAGLDFSRILKLR